MESGTAESSLLMMGDLVVVFAGFFRRLLRYLSRNERLECLEPENIGSGTKPVNFLINSEYFKSENLFRASLNDTFLFSTASAL